MNFWMWWTHKIQTMINGGMSINHLTNWCISCPRIDINFCGGKNSHINYWHKCSSVATLLQESWNIFHFRVRRHQRLICHLLFFLIEFVFRKRLTSFSTMHKIPFWWYPSILTLTFIKYSQQISLNCQHYLWIKL